MSVETTGLVALDVIWLSPNTRKDASATTIQYVSATRHLPDSHIGRKYCIDLDTSTNNADTVSIPLAVAPSDDSDSLICLSPQDASLLRLPGAYARYVQEGIQG